MTGIKSFGASRAARIALAAPLLAFTASSAVADPARPEAAPANPPKVVLISLDGAMPGKIRQLLADGVLPADGGIGRLVARGVMADGNVTANPSLTAVSHIAIATGSTAVNNDIPANSFHPVAGAISAGLSGFAAPIGGYDLDPVGPSATPTAEPLWVKLRNAGKKVVAATWPGADGATISVNGVVAQQAEPTRVVDFTVPFGAFGGLGTVGFSLTASDFKPDHAIAMAIRASGHPSYSQVRVTPEPIEIFSCSSSATATCSTSTPLDVTYRMRVAVTDTTDDGVVNYDTLVFFDAATGVTSGEPKAPSTSPAYAKVGDRSAPFYLEGSGAKVGTAYFAVSITPDLSSVKFIRYSSYYIPRNAPVLDIVDEINGTVGFWRPQPDFRIPERLSPGLDAFTDLELEKAYKDQGRTFVAYQGRLAERAIRRNPGADLVMVYFEEPDGATHQYLLTDPRQATNPRDPSTIGAGQERSKVIRYASYVEDAYRQVDKAVGDILDLTGPETTVFLVSDHGFAPFHTAVNLTNLLRNEGVDVSKLSIRTSGPAANVYVNLAGREAGGTVSASEYQTLVAQVARALRTARDPNGTFNYSLENRRLFSNVKTRPSDCAEGPGFCVDRFIGQDFGDVFAQLDLGYNFDGTQSPIVIRSGDPAGADPATIVLSAPNFYGAHGHEASKPEMSATFIAAGPGIRRGQTIEQVRNIDVAPTIERILGVAPAETVDGKALRGIFE